MKLIDGKEIAENIYKELAAKLEGLQTKPKLAIILASNDEPSKIYVGLKKKKAEDLGITCEVFYFQGDVSAETIKNKILELNSDMGIQGILVQLPLYSHLKESTEDILNTVDPKKDIDGLTDANQDLSNGSYKGKLLSATVLAILKSIEYASEGVSLSEYLKNKNIVIINTSRLIGKPLASYLSNFTDTITLANRKTENLSSLTRQADILVTATGHLGLISASDLKRGSVVIDVTSMRDVDGKTKGDVVWDSELEETADYYTPVPGGVGPVTVASLLQNLVTASNGRD